MADFALLPKPFLYKLFLYLQFDPTLDEYEECCYCRRPYWWLYRGRVSQTFRLVCRRWRKVYWEAVVLIPTIRENIKVCPTPEVCLAAQGEHVKRQGFKHKTIYLRFYSQGPSPQLMHCRWNVSLRGKSVGGSLVVENNTLIVHEDVSDGR